MQILDKAARRLMEHARAFEPVHDGRIYIEKINAPFLCVDKGTAEHQRWAGLCYRARMDRDYSVHSLW